MALTPEQRVQVRQLLAQAGIPITYTKPQIDAVADALDTWWITTGRPSGAAAIEAAVPGVFTAQQKLAIGKVWLLIRAGIE
jgi:hypothetical protein